jgi:hypothetical protein
MILGDKPLIFEVVLSHYPPGMGKEEIANRSSSSTMRGRKLARRRRFFDEVGLRWPVAVLRRGGERGR